jgi:hypothetical protein
LSAPNQPRRSGRGGAENEITPLEQHWLLPFRGTIAYRPNLSLARPGISFFYLALRFRTASCKRVTELTLDKLGNCDIE